MYVKECVDKECVTKCVLTKSVSKCMLTKCMWTKSVVTKSVWTKSVCVKVYVDKVCVDKKKSERGREAEEAEHGIQNQKQEPHTKLWGKKRKDRVEVHLPVASSSLLSQRYCTFYFFM